MLDGEIMGRENTLVQDSEVDISLSIWTKERFQMCLSHDNDLSSSTAIYFQQ